MAMSRHGAKFAGRGGGVALGILLALSAPVLKGWDEIPIGTTEILNDVWVAGGTVFAAGNNGTVVSGNSGWSPMATGTTDDLLAIWGDAGNNVYAAGGHILDQYSQTGRVLHYDGSSWSTVRTSLAGRYHAVWGDSAGNVFAVGQNGAADRFDGTTWRECRFDPGWDEAWNAANFRGVWGSGPTRVMVSGSNEVLLFDGTTWSAMTAASGSMGHIYKIWDDLGVGPFGVAYTCGGNIWSQQASNIPVYGTDLFGRYATIGSTITYWLGGSTWSEIPFPDGSPSGIHGSGGDLYLAGAKGPMGFMVGALWRGGVGGSSPPTTTPTPGAGTYPYAQSVTLAAEDNLGGDVGILATFYTTDGTEPDESSSQYSSPISIAADTVLKFFSIDNHGNREAVQTAAYTILSPDPSLLGGPGGNPHTVFAAGEEVAPEIGLPRYSVNTSTLNLVLVGTLYRSRGPGPSTHVTLTYNAGATDTPGQFGQGWRMNSEASILLAGDGISVQVAKGSGQVLTFTSPVDLNGGGIPYPVTLPPPDRGCRRR